MRSMGFVERVDLRVIAVANNEKTPTITCRGFSTQFLVYQFKLVVSRGHPGRQNIVAARLHDQLIVCML